MFLVVCALGSNHLGSQSLCFVYAKDVCLASNYISFGNILHIHCYYTHRHLISLHSHSPQIGTTTHNLTISLFQVKQQQTNKQIPGPQKSGAQKHSLNILLPAEERRSWDPWCFAMDQRGQGKETQNTTWKNNMEKQTTTTLWWNMMKPNQVQQMSTNFRNVHPSITVCDSNPWCTCRLFLVHGILQLPLHSSTFQWFGPYFILFPLLLHSQFRNHIVFCHIFFQRCGVWMGFHMLSIASHGEGSSQLCRVSVRLRSRRQRPGAWPRDSKVHGSHPGAKKWWHFKWNFHESNKNSRLNHMVVDDLNLFGRLFLMYFNAYYKHLQPLEMEEPPNNTMVTEQKNNIIQICDSPNIVLRLTSNSTFPPGLGAVAPLRRINIQERVQRLRSMSTTRLTDQINIITSSHIYGRLGLILNPLKKTACVQWPSSKTKIGWVFWCKPTQRLIIPQKR